jgi:hypothetical protein
MVDDPVDHRSSNDLEEQVRGPHHHYCHVGSNLTEQCMTDIQWLSAPGPHVYPCARAFLLLLLSPDEVDDVLAGFTNSEITFFKAKDILRASELKPLRDANFQVNRDLKKIKSGKALSPILRVRSNPDVCSEL